MKRYSCTIIFICICLLLSMSTFAIESKQPHTFDCITSAEEFLTDVTTSFCDSFNLSSQAEIWIGAEVPCYICTNNDEKYIRAIDAIYPILSENTVIGLLNVHCLPTGNYTFAYSEGLSNVINSRNEKIAILSDGRTQTILFESSYYEQESQLCIEGIEFIYPYLKNEQLSINKTKEVNTLPNTYSLNVPAKQQLYSSTCWAACIASVAQYYTGIAYTTIGIINATGNSSGATMSMVYSTLNSMNIPVSGIYTSLSVNTLMNNIYSGKPMIGGFLYGGTSGHMMVIRGYSSSSSNLSMLLMDPMIGGNVAVSIISGSNMSFNYSGLSWYLNEYIRIG